jgi:hypothetical protein
MRASSDMIKLYVLYVVFGFYILHHSLLLWLFPFYGDGSALQTYMAFGASVILSFVMPGICLYRPQLAPGAGLLCLAVISPFGIHWLQYRIMNPYLILWSAENIIMFAAVIWYLVAVIVSINIFMVRKSLTINLYNRKLKLSLALLPFTMFIALCIFVVMQ